MRSLNSTICTLFIALLPCMNALMAHATGPVPYGDLQTAVHCLGFLESLPTDGYIVTAVLYDADHPSTLRVAEDTARALNSMPGPNASHFEATALSVADLSRRTGRLDLVFVVPGALAHAEEIRALVVRNRALSISDDPACFDKNCCVLMARSASPASASLVNSIISMAASLNLSCIAEGVEIAEQLAYLQAQKCPEIQGFFFSPPLPADECLAFLSSPTRLR